MNIKNTKPDLYWNQQYEANEIGWDLGAISPPLKAYIDQLSSKDLRILIPGAGNSHEAKYLLEQGFSNVSIIDISSVVTDHLKEKFSKYPQLHVYTGDFFIHEGVYDLILEQTFFCAINPALRQDYVAKMHALLADKGKLVGVLFNKIFEKEGPPFSGSRAEYEPMFKKYFNLNHFDLCYNSVKPRADSELFINFTKKETLSFIF
jgi:SAM-dependent methyltransferase